MLTVNILKIPGELKQFSIPYGTKVRELPIVKDSFLEEYEPCMEACSVKLPTVPGTPRKRLNPDSIIEEDCTIILTAPIIGSTLTRKNNGYIV